MSVSEWKDLLELASYVVIILGVPAAIFQYWRSKHREQQDREYGTYNALDEKYLEFQRLCFENPQLDVFDIPDQELRALTSTEQKQELVAFTMLFSIFERAYLMYADQSSSIKRRQWTGWLDYLTDFCTRENFRRAWRISGNTFDTTFQEFVESILTRVERTKPSARVRAADVTAPADVATITDLVTKSYIAGSQLTGNEVAHLLTKSMTKAYLAETGTDAAGALVATSLSEDRVVLIVGIGIRGPHHAATMTSLLRSIATIASGALVADALVVEGPSAAAPTIEQSIPGMGCFRALDFPHRYPDRSPAQLWVWTTADSIPRDHLRTLVEQLLRFYNQLYAETRAADPINVDERVREMLRRTPDLVRVRPVASPLRVAASER